MNIAVLMPIHKTMEAACVTSLLAMTNILHGDGHVLRFYFANGFNAARARVGLAREMAKDVDFKADFVLWLDSDHQYETSAFMKLVNAIEEHNLPMLSASYKLRGTDMTVHGITEDGKYRFFDYKELNACPEGQMMEAQVVGFGFLVMRAQFLRDMWDKHGEELFKMDIGMNGTEDVAFCQWMIKDGYKVLFHPKVRVGHMELCVRI